MPASTALAAQIQAYLEPRLLYYLTILRQMMAINSFSANPAGVNALAELTAQTFAPLGFSAQSVQAANPAYGKHLILTRPGLSGRTIGLVSHLDTVFPPEEEQANHFCWQEEGDKIYGPGANDIKGGTVMMLMVLDALKTLAPAAFAEVTWVLALNAAEERLSEDFGPLCLQHLGPNALACLIFEAGKVENNAFKLAVARKGRAQFEVTVTGKAAHAGNGHHSGANAIVQLSHTIQKIAALTDYEQQLTFNVGAVSGGTVVNRVPHQAQAQVEMRAFAPAVFAAGVEAIQALGRDIAVFSAADGYPCRVQITQTEQTGPWPPNSSTDRLYAIWEAAAQTMGRQAQREHRGGLSDGNQLWHAVPTLDGLGPAGANDHCSERSADGSKEPEYVLKSSFVPKAALNTLAILPLISQT